MLFVFRYPRKFFMNLIYLPLFKYRKNTFIDPVGLIDIVKIIDIS